MQLKELFDKHGSDKASKHHYHKVYAGVLSEIPVPVIWEIGVDSGASLAAWQEAAPGAVVVGIDLFKRHTMDEVRRNAPQAKLFKHDSTQSFPSGVAPRPGLIVDDGSHFFSDQQATLRSFWPHLADGGIYCIEDVWVANLDEPHPWTRRHPGRYTHAALDKLSATARALDEELVVHDLSGNTGQPDSCIWELRK